MTEILEYLQGFLMFNVSAFAAVLLSIIVFFITRWHYSSNRHQLILAKELNKDIADSWKEKLDLVQKDFVRHQEAAEGRINDLKNTKNTYGGLLSELKNALGLLIEGDIDARSNSYGLKALCVMYAFYNSVAIQFYSMRMHSHKEGDVSKYLDNALDQVELELKELATLLEEPVQEITRQEGYLVELIETFRFEELHMRIVEVNKTIDSLLGEYWGAISVADV